MSVVRINVLEVPEERRELLEQRFAGRAGEVEKTPGFESFELLRPTDGSNRYFVYTRWESEEAFEAWVSSRRFQQGHAQTDAAHASEGPPDHGSGEAQADAERPEGDAPPHGGPAATGSELLSFEVVLSAVAASPGE